MKLYHGTSKENWESIQKDGFLKSPTGLNFLSISTRYATNYGKIILEVDFDPTDDEFYYPHYASRAFDCRQVVTKKSISLEKIKRII